MPIKLVIVMIITAILLVIISTHYLVKGRIPEKYALLWYAFSLLILILSLIPNVLTFLAKLLGFQLVSNMVLVLLIGILFLLVMALTIMIAGQKKKTTLLIQELSILQEKVDKNNESK